MRILYKLKRKYLNLGLTRKIVIIYIIAVLLPTSVLAVYFYDSNLKGLEEIYYENQTNVILAARENLVIQINQIASSYNYFQQSDTLLDLLGGAYTDTANTLFYYIRDVSPLISAAKLNPYISNVGIYGYGEYSLNMTNGLASIQYLDRDQGFIDEVRAGKIVWELDLSAETPALNYCRNIYANTNPYDRGLLLLTVDFAALLRNFYSQIERPVYFTGPQGELYGYEDGKITAYDFWPDILDESENFVRRLSFPEGFPQMLVPILPMKDMERQRVMLLFVLLILVFIFTAFYVLLSYSITSRLKAFAFHIRNMDVEDMVPFDGGGYLDEVGVVVSSYNDLVERKNCLIHEKLKAQIQKKESDYYALQAQIKPHFLYNILENIRMSAEAHKDEETADMLLALGKHMRYNLNMSAQPISLENELFFARNYLQICKIRMKDKIHFEVLIATEIDSVYCPRFLLQPILENALNHGYRLDRPLFIRVLVSDGEDNGNEVKVIIEDNGNGIPGKELKNMQEKLAVNAVEKESHVGLLNVNSRLAAFKGADSGCLFIESREGKGTVITLYLEKKSDNTGQEGAQTDENTDCGG